MIECNCTYIRILGLAGISDMNLNPMGGIGIHGIISSAISESLKNLKKQGYPEMPLLFVPEDNEEILHGKSNELWLSWKNPCNAAGFKESIAHILELPYLNFRYTIFIQSRMEEIRRYFGKHFAIETGTREGY